MKLEIMVQEPCMTFGQVMDWTHILAAPRAHNGVIEICQCQYQSLSLHIIT